MTAVESWLRAQTTIVDGQDGSSCATIQLEGSDGTIWGTWRTQVGAQSSKLAETIAQAIAMIEAELPSGRHRGKLVALDGDARQTALLPLTFAGRSAASAAAGTEAHAMQRAVSLMVQNADAVTAGLREENERLLRRNSELLDQCSTLIEGTFNFQQALATFNADAEARAARTKRLDALMERAAPLIDLGMGLAAEWAAEQFEALREARRAKELRPKPVDRNDPPRADTGGATAASEESGRSAPQVEPATDAGQGDGSGPGEPPPETRRDGATGPAETEGAGEENRPRVARRRVRRRK